ncbi:MAG: fimbrial biogenesis chaperone [Janthinobacterium lividum]
MLFKIKIWQFFVLKILTLFSIQLGQAGSFNINPVQINFNKDQKIETLIITNYDSNPLTVHLKVKKWHQKNGENFYVDTKDLLMAPPIATIDANSSQVIRLALKAPRHDHNENAYRLFITEIPNLESHNVTQTGLNFTLNISMPIFVHPLNDASVEPVFQASISQGQLRLKNSGRRHGHLKSVHIPGVTKQPIEITRYILPQQESLINLPQTNGVQGLRLVADINNQKRTLDVSQESQNSSFASNFKLTTDAATSQR